jgi:hypothetical protein
MARVWRAWDPKLGREVAVKEPLFDERLSEDVLREMGERFVREGMAAARLNHPGIVTIFAADVYDGRPAIVMELVDGVTLGDLLEAGPLAPRAALDALDQLLDAVGYAHSQGVVHRDIKPDNVFVTRDGRVKLGDFGIAHVADSSLTRRTQVGTVLGTPGYMAPEQATGAPVDSRADLFAIGVMAYEMLAGRNPFGAGGGTDPTALLYRIVHEAPPPLPSSAAEGLPADVRPAVLAALAKDPAGRPQDAASLKAMLHGAPAPAPGAAQASPLAKAASSGSRRWLPYAIAAAVGIAVLGAVFVLATSGGGGGGAAAGGGAVAADGPSGGEGGAGAAVAAAVPRVDGVGDRVEFGAWRGGPIEWRVLAVEGGRALVVSEDVLERRGYHGSRSSVTWAESDIRAWLNGEFLDTAFTGEQQGAIALSQISNPDNPEFGTEGGPDTEDRVFLLSIDEAERYFSGSDDRVAEHLGEDRALPWWLRSPGADGHRAAVVIVVGGVRVDGYSVYCGGGVRPALWLNLQS